MASSKAETVEEYLETLPDDRREAISAVRDVILKNLPKGYDESIAYGMIGYEVPLETFPETYNKKPLSYAALASQKNYMSLYLHGVYSSPELFEWFQEEYKATGKKLDMGKSCVRFKTLDDLPLDLIGKTIKSTTVKQFIAAYEEAKGSEK